MRGNQVVAALFVVFVIAVLFVAGSRGNLHGLSGNSSRGSAPISAFAASGHVVVPPFAVPTSRWPLKGTIKNMQALPHYVHTSLKGVSEFNTLYNIDERVGRVVVPDSFAPKVRSMFKNFPGGSQSLHFVETQTIVTSYNRFTLEHSLFNEIRRYRPGYRETITAEEDAAIEKAINATREGCDFCSGDRVAVDIFGKLKGRHCYVASNVAKYEKWHSLLVANEHHPFKFKVEHIEDYIATAHRWFAKVHELDASAIYPHLMWDCMGRASASQMHQHLQMSIVDVPYSKLGIARMLAERYAHSEGGNLWSDIVRAHQQVGLASIHGNCAIMAYLTPIKEREVVVVGSSKDTCFPRLFYAALTALLRHGTRSYSAAVVFEPLAGRQSLPAIVRIIDRGAPGDVRNDAGAMEFYGSNNVGQDPFMLMAKLKETIQELVDDGTLPKPLQ